jgi:hypothetical protein
MISDHHDNVHFASYTIPADETDLDLHTVNNEISTGTDAA